MTSILNMPIWKSRKFADCLIMLTIMIVMMTPTISFSYPRRGLVGEFATFRLGASAAQKYQPGTVVELVDSRSKKLIKRATVTRVCAGALTDMAVLYSHMAHNWKEHPSEERAGLLIASMLRRYKHYGPTRCSETAIVSVIFLREEIECQLT